MANIERTASCPPQLSVESNEESCDEAGSQEVFNDLSPSVSNEVSPIKSSSEMLRAVDMQAEWGRGQIFLSNALYNPIRDGGGVQHPPTENQL